MRADTRALYGEQRMDDLRSVERNSGMRFAEMNYDRVHELVRSSMYTRRTAQPTCRTRRI